VTFLFGVSVVPRYVPSTSSTMPVTTRSQAQHLQSINHGHSISSSSGSSLSFPFPLTLNTFSTMPTCNSSTASSSTLTTSTIKLLDQDSGEVNNRSIASMDFEFEKSSSVSKFQTLAVSNDINFDLGIRHNSSISNNNTTMEADCEDSKTMSSPTHDIQDMNKLFEALSNHLTVQTTRLHDHFQQVLEMHDDFKLEVRQELDALCL